MSHIFHDRAPIEKVRRLGDGRIAAVAKFARSGCYEYAGAELGRPDLSKVTVYRPEDEVFSEDAMASFAHKAITLDHPDEPVSASNWSKVSVGYTEGRVARDGGFVEIPLILADASAVTAYESGTARQLSAGYQCELVWGDGVAPDGTSYQAKQVGIRGNHLAIVAAGRAGNECRIGDSAASDATYSSPRDAYIDRLTGVPEGSTAKARCLSNALADARMTMPAQRSDAQAVRDAARQQYVSNLAGAAAANDAAYERSKTTPNDWRKDAAKSAEAVASMRAARWR